MKIIISPYSRKLRGKDSPNPKNWPKEYWEELVRKLVEKGHEIIQVGVEGEEKLMVSQTGVEGYKLTWKFGLPLSELKELIKECDSWVSCDNFFHHFCWLIGKPGIVIFSQSDPLIFGHAENKNLLKDRKYLRSNQFGTWEEAEYNKEAFVEPERVLNALLGE